MRKWQFPNCLGVIDGRHMRIQAPLNSGSTFFNYKQFFIMMLLAICDASYKFTWVDIGQYGFISDGRVWANTDFANDIAAGNLPLPNPTPLPETNIPFSFVFIGDKAFPLSTYMMRSYPRKNLTDDMRIFNYRLSRAQRTIKNAFGILTAQWRILYKPLCMSTTNSENVKALIGLHNFIMYGDEQENMNNRQYCTTDLIDTEKRDGSIRERQWRRHFPPHFAELGQLDVNRADSITKEMRNILKGYFVFPVGEAQAPWQYENTFRGAIINPLVI
ncbi:uncharacterized protein LOC120359861 [Solenopsis invicta]|uniref:uncharacterized protein LOC120359861 n=1 Tax=Solenopsis invicta TaxID=13686 RepID=UPI00193E875F|nr:uncharacterized protein LOC120359861 [Solenopsis invicta]